MPHRGQQCLGLWKVEKKFFPLLRGKNFLLKHLVKDLVKDVKTSCLLLRPVIFLYSLIKCWDFFTGNIYFVFAIT